MNEIDFTDVFHALPDRYLVINGHLTIVAVNASFRKLSWVNDDCIGKELHEVLTLSVESLSEIVQQAVASGNSRIDTRTISLEFTRLPDSAKGGDHMLVKLTVRESELDRAHRSAEKILLEQAQQSQRLFVDLFEYNPAALAISRLSDSKIILVNNAFLLLFDFDEKAQVLGKTAKELNIFYDPEQRERVIALLQKGEKVLTLEGKLRTHTKQVKWSQTSILSIDYDGQPCLMAVLLDITDRKKAEENIKGINANLEDLLAKRTKEKLATELEYQSVIEQANDAIFISDSKGKYLSANPKACTMLGYTQQELLTMNAADILKPGEAEQTPLRFYELTTGKRLTRVRYLQRKDGTTFSGEISASMLANGNMLGMVRDISHRIKYEEDIQQLNAALEEKVNRRTAQLQDKIIQLEESEDKFQKAFGASSAGISLTRLSDAKYVEVNDAFLDLIGYSREEVINKSSADLNLVVEVQAREHVLENVQKQGSLKQVQMTIRKRTGQLTNILCSIETILHHGEEFAINIIYDITELKQAQEKLQDANKELEAFSYSVSHDLRAPLRSIIGFSEILRDSHAATLNDDGRRLLERIDKGANRMWNLIEDLLAFSKLSRQEIVKVKIDATALVKEIADECSAEKGCTASFIIEDILPCYGDPGMIKQLWSNLISNAIKYSSKTESPVVEIVSYRHQGDTVYSVKDNGVGFNMQYAPKLFGVFQRLHKSSEFEGTGVGLALVKRILDKHSGKIWAEAAEGKGATFFFSLPCNEE